MTIKTVSWESEDTLRTTVHEYDDELKTLTTETFECGDPVAGSRKVVFLGMQESVNDCIYWLFCELEMTQQSLEETRDIIKNSKDIQRFRKLEAAVKCFMDVADSVREGENDVATDV